MMCLTLTSPVSDGSLDEVPKLRQKLWGSRRRRSRYSGIVFLGMGVVFLALTLQTPNPIFEVTFLLSIFIGSLLSLRETESYIKVGTANAMMLSLFLSLKNLLYEIGVDGRIEYIPSGKGLDIVSAQVSVQEREYQIILLELSRPLAHIYELEMGDLKRLELSDLYKGLTKVIVDGLLLAQGIVFKPSGDLIEVVVRKPTIWAIYLEESLKPIIGKIGCPLSSSIAESIAKCLGRVVMYQGYDYSISEETVRFMYELGTKVEL